MTRIRFGVVGCIGLLAVVQGWTNSRRPYPAQLTGDANLRVTNSDDQGLGSLREAILSADRLSSRTRIEVLVNRIDLASPLPPLINPNGLTIESAGKEFAVDASHTGTAGPVLEIRSSFVVIRNMRMENAPRTAILLGSDGLRIEKSTFSGCDTAIQVDEGGGNLLIDNSVFEKNRIGLQADVFDRTVTVQNSKFLSQSQAGIWAVSQAISPAALMLNVDRNQFSDNRFGMVFANHRIHVHDNQITLSREAGIQLFGSGAVVEHNTISEGAATGILADGTSGSVIAENEIHNNKAVAIVIKNSDNDTIRHNTIYANGNGIAFVYGHAQSPVIASENDIFSQTGEPIVIIGESPVLRNNVIRSNNLNGAKAGSLPVSLPAASKPSGGPK
jgi:parallel beta-helix repeat protein